MQEKLHVLYLVVTHGAQAACELHGSGDGHLEYSRGFRKSIIKQRAREIVVYEYRNQQKKTKRKQLIFEYTGSFLHFLRMAFQGKSGISHHQDRVTNDGKITPKTFKNFMQFLRCKPTQLQIALLTDFKPRLVFGVAFLYNLSLHRPLGDKNQLGHDGSRIFHHLCRF